MHTCTWPGLCHCHSLSLASVKSRLVLPFWYWPTWVVPEKGLLNCVCACACACVCVFTYAFLVLLYYGNFDLFITSLNNWDGKKVTEITYFVSSGTLNLNSVKQCMHCSKGVVCTKFDADL